jgi:CRISP-associated protein Cas1
MIKHTIEISQNPAYLSVKLDQLQISRKDGEEDKTVSVACEDVGVLLLDHPQITCSQAALSKLVEAGAVVVLCGKNHLPAGLLLPLGDHCEGVHRIHDQINAGQPLRKRLWQQIIIAKVRAQANNLHQNSAAKEKLTILSQQIHSGDPMNIEAQAAKIYWAAWLGENEKFKRDTDGDGINGLLNYGYAILRAGVARALVSAGLSPSLGIHHCNRSNAFCLADDLMEPLRPLVDHRVRELIEKGFTALDKSSKAGLLQLLTFTVDIQDFKGPLMVALHRYTASLVRCFTGEDKSLHIPHPVMDHENTAEV